jgi:hypothetical protein
MQLRDMSRPVGLIAAAMASWCAVTTPAAAADEERSFDIYGFAQLDWIQDSKRVNPSWMDAFRPSKIADPEGEFGTNGQSSLSVKQSRFGVKGLVPTSDQLPPIEFKFEFDLFGVGVDAGQTTFRLRYAYGEWGQLLAGQTTSLFMDLDIFPDVIDYWGPCGMVFLRDPQLRWTAYRTLNDRIAIALEKPSNDIDPGNIRLIEGYEAFSVQGNQVVPDVTAQYRHDDTWGHYQVAAILRDVGYNYQITSTEPYQKGSKAGWGIDLSGAYKIFGKDDLRAGIVYGHGIASYMNDGGMDLAPNATNSGGPVPQLSAEAVPLTGVALYYGHYWTPKWESSLGYSFTEVTNTNFQTPGIFHKGQYASGNLLWYPADKVMIGAEVLWGQLTENNGAVGIDWRFQFSVKYNYGVKL